MWARSEKPLLCCSCVVCSVTDDEKIELTRNVWSAVCSRQFSKTHRLGGPV